MQRKLLIIFGKKVRGERKKKGWSQEDLAGHAKVHRTYIGMIERGEKNITLENIAKLCNALGLTMKEFFGDFD